MHTAQIRWTLHAAHAVASLALLATGLLIELPDLRARLVGGYGRELARLHDGAGLVFLGAPALSLALAARHLLADTLRRLGPPEGFTWKKLHLVSSGALSVVLAATGGLLWLDDLPLSIADVALELHIGATWLFLAALIAHLFAARRKIAARLVAVARPGRDDDFPFEPFDEDDDREEEPR